MKRKRRIPIRVTAAEKEIIVAAAEAEGINVSQMLRFLGLHADKFSEARRSLLELTSWLNHLKLIACSPDIDTKPEDIEAAVNKAIAPIRSIEEALSLSRAMEHLDPDA